MSQRFKSSYNYFEKKSNLTGKVVKGLLEPKPVAPTRPRDCIVPVETAMDLFCGTVERYRVNGGDIAAGGRADLEARLADHLAGEALLAVDPVTRTGATAWHIVRLEKTPEFPQPFAVACNLAAEFAERGVPTLLEVTEGGKGHYRLWVFHAVPVDAARVADTLSSAVSSHGLPPSSVAPTCRGEFIDLPLQKESALLQRRVFVNTVGKPLRNQAEALAAVERVSLDTVLALADKAVAPAETKKAANEPVKVKKTAAPSETAKTPPPVTAPAKAQEKRPSKDYVPAPAIKAASDSAKPTTAPPSTVRISHPETPRIRKSADATALSADPDRLVFRAGDAVYSLPKKAVRCVLDAAALLPAPGELAPLAGWIAWEGRHIQVRLLRSDQETPLPGKRVLVLGNGSPFGIIADLAAAPVAGADTEELDPDTLALAFTGGSAGIQPGSRMTCIVARCGTVTVGFAADAVRWVLAPGQAERKRDALVYGGRTIPAEALFGKRDNPIDGDTVRRARVHRDRYIVLAGAEETAVHVDDILGIGNLVFAGWLGDIAAGKRVRIIGYGASDMAAGPVLVCESSDAG